MLIDMLAATATFSLVTSETATNSSSSGTQTRWPASEYLNSQSVLEQGLQFTPSTTPSPSVIVDGATMQGETAAFLEFLQNEEYDHRESPNHGAADGRPTLIQVSIMLSSIRKVSEVTMDYSIEVFFREKWRDPRLEYGASKFVQFENKSEIGLHESYAAFLWHPDTFVPNAIKSTNTKDNSITHRSLLRLQPDGSILFSRRLSITAECPMDLTMFPFDQQICRLEIESYGYRTNEVMYAWMIDGLKDPIQWDNHDIKLPDFSLDMINTTHTVGVYSTGNYSRLIACFFFTRSSGFCFLQLIMPATAVVITSWIALWMENETTFQDLISVILTLTMLIYSYNTVMPSVSYIKAMDVYLGACFFFVFISLIKLAFIKYMRQHLMIDKNQSIVCQATPMVNIVGQLNSVLLLRNTYDPNTPTDDPSAMKRKMSSVTQRHLAVQNGDRRTSHAFRRDIVNEKHVVISNRFVTIHSSVACMKRFHLVTQVLLPMFFISFIITYFMLISHMYPSQREECIP